jgi:hypothetical protein
MVDLVSNEVTTMPLTSTNDAPYSLAADTLDPGVFFVGTVTKILRVKCDDLKVMMEKDRNFGEIHGIVCDPNGDLLFSVYSPRCIMHATRRTVDELGPICQLVGGGSGKTMRDGPFSAACLGVPSVLVASPHHAQLLYCIAYSPYEGAPMIRMIDRKESTLTSLWSLDPPTLDFHVQSICAVPASKSSTLDLLVATCATTKCIFIVRPSGKLHWPSIESVN